MNRADAIKRGLVIAGNGDYARNECLRKVGYTDFVQAFTEAARLAARKEQDGKRLRIYCCRFCSRLHIGNYTPGSQTIAGQVLTLSKQHKEALGKLSSAQNELEQCKRSRDKLRSELGQAKFALAKRSLWRFLSWAWNRGRHIGSKKEVPHDSPL